VGDELDHDIQPISKNLVQGGNRAGDEFVEDLRHQRLSRENYGYLTDLSLVS
jgi:hypothetical protein